MKPMLWVLPAIALVLGLLIGLRPLINVKRDGDGEGHVNIIINFGFVNVNPVNFNGNTKREKDK